MSSRRTQSSFSSASALLACQPASSRSQCCRRCLSAFRRTRSWRRGSIWRLLRIRSQVYSFHSSPSERQPDQSPPLSFRRNTDSKLLSKFIVCSSSFSWPATSYHAATLRCFRRSPRSQQGTPRGRLRKGTAWLYNHQLQKLQSKIRLCDHKSRINEKVLFFSGKLSIF